MDTVRLAGRSVLFLLECLLYGFVRPFKIRRITEQILFIGARSSVIILITGAFAGMVLGLQGYYTLRKFGSEGLLGSAVALSIIRELGPVLTALMVAGRAGSSMTAEIGIMKITEQINALEMMAVNPLKFVVSPKLFAGLISLPLLTAFFDVIGIGGGYLVGVHLLGVNSGSYFGEMIKAVDLADITGGFYKSIAFGLVISWVCSFIGYTAEATTEGVASATTNAVVVTSVAILILDYILTSFLL
ncbi:MAG: ABC transporter permease [Deltaproteobacteria bacterium]|jgi:phospholipid/cholesterol/gamma-HCH transport system permease protein|uniref:ABC transporter permease n=2 Tax=Desulforhabdus amnigena TaxID=40218 RepID=A0A9W6CZS9_9BACT|nr:ABC transporter permease [Deltaproteobacteria bacterium]GLI32668.1 ABC transporter permease [Desulforhabdus amnigena]